jgi:hypothetical protein
MPLIVQSINADDEGLIASTLQTLSMLIKEAPNMVSEHVSAFVPALLRLTTFRPKMVRSRPAAHRFFPLRRRINS